MAKSQKKTTKREAKAAKKAVMKKSASKEAAIESLGIKKEYLKNGNVCKTTFWLPETAAADARSVYIVGDFNNWDIRANPMEKLGNGHFTATIELDPGREYEFRYLIDESKWENDWNADKYVTSPFGDSDNSVVMV